MDRRVRRKLAGHRRGAERAIEQRKQQEPGEKAAEMGDPGHRHVREAEHLGPGAENEIRPEPDQNEDERAALEKDAARLAAGIDLDLRPADRAERAERRPGLKHEPGRRAHEAGIRPRRADEGREIHRRD